MKKQFLALLCLVLPVAGAFGFTAGDLQKLPIGSWAAINGQLEKEINEINVEGPGLDSEMYSVGGWSYYRQANYRYDPYKPNLGGSLVEAIATTMTNACRNSIEVGNAYKGVPGYDVGQLVNTNDAGRDLFYRVHISTPTAQIFNIDKGGVKWMWSIVNYESYPRKFKAVFDQNGQLVIPQSELVFDWPLVSELPITDGLKGVELVEYILKDRTGRVVIRDATKNGVESSWCGEGLYTNQVLWLSMKYVDPDMLRRSNYSGTVTLWYNKTNNVFDTFDLLTGNKIQSKVLRLQVAKTVGGLSVTFVGIPGRQVSVETSADAKVWTETSSVVTLNSQGKGVFTLPNTLPNLFVRGRFK